jgi:hypothetical protein
MSIQGKNDFTAGCDENHLGLPAGASASTYAPRASPVAGAYFVRSTVGNGWRERTEHGGLVAQLQDVAVRLHDLVGIAGRSTTRPGTARKDASCSTG